MYTGTRTYFALEDELINDHVFPYPYFFGMRQTYPTNLEYFCWELRFFNDNKEKFE